MHRCAVLADNPCCQLASRQSLRVCSWCALCCFAAGGLTVGCFALPQCHDQTLILIQRLTAGGCWNQGADAFDFDAVRHPLGFTQDLHA